MFTDEQKKILLKYYDDGMTSTNRQHADLIDKCAKECQTTVDRIKVKLLGTILMYFYYHKFIMKLVMIKHIISMNISFL